MWHGGHSDKKVGPVLSLGDFSQLGVRPAHSLPFPSLFSGPEGGDLAQTAAAAGCLQVPAQLPKPLSCFHPRSWAGESVFQGLQRD